MSFDLQVQKFLVNDCPVDRKLSTCHGTRYRFLASAYDADSIPLPDFTTIYVRDMRAEASPAYWRANATNPELVIELEQVSDAKLNSMADEADSCWRQFSHDVHKRVRWMNLLGVHSDIQARMLSPLALRITEINTLQDDMLAILYSASTTDMSKIAVRLRDLEHTKEVQDQEPIVVSFQEFLWPAKTKSIPAWAAGRYAQALANQFASPASSFAPSDV